MLTNIMKIKQISKYIRQLQTNLTYQYVRIKSYQQTLIKILFSTKKQLKIQLNQHKTSFPMQSNTEILKQTSMNIIREYPFITIPRYYIFKFEQLTIQKTLAKDIVAFICLSSAKQQIHKKAFSILFPQKAKYMAFNRQHFEKRRQIFTEYFQPRIHQFIDKINDSQCLLNDKIIALNILVQLSISQSLSNLIINLNQSIIAQQQSGTLLALYVHLMVKHKKPYQKYLAILANKLNNQQVIAKHRISIIKSIISIPNYVTIIPNSLINLSIKLIKYQIHNLSNEDIIRIIGILYTFKSSDGTLLSIQLQQFISQLKPQRNPSRSQLFLELIIKVMKYSFALSLSCQKFVTDLINNISKYEIYLKQNNITKQNMISSLFLAYRQDFSPTVSSILRYHILSVVQSISKNPQGSQNQIFMIVKVIKCHSRWLSTDNKATLKKLFLKHILPVFQNNQDILYESLVIILENDSSLQNQSTFVTENNQNINQQAQKFQSYLASQSQQIIKYLQFYFSKTCSRNNINQMHIHSNISQIIDLALLLTKNNLKMPQSNLPLICKYSFTAKDLANLRTLQQLIEYLMTLSKQQNPDILYTLNNIFPVIQGFINKKYLRFRTAINLIELADRCKYQNKYFYLKIEDMLFQLMHKTSTFHFTTHNLYLLKDKFVPHMKKGSSFQTLIYQTLKSPNSWDEHKQKYLDRERKRRNKKSHQYHQKRNNSNYTVNND